MGGGKARGSVEAYAFSRRERSWPSRHLHFQFIANKMERGHGGQWERGREMNIEKVMN